MWTGIREQNGCHDRRCRCETTLSKLHVRSKGTIEDAGDGMLQVCDLRANIDQQTIHIVSLLG